MAKFEWNESKRQKTLQDRGLDFAEAHKAFEDDYAFFAPDPRYDSDDRWILIGRLEEHLVVVVAYKEPTHDTYRIISMRRAEKHEINRYEKERSKQLPAKSDPLTRLIDQLKRDRESREEIE
jgi:uncharacterized protein